MNKLLLILVSISLNANAQFSKVWSFKTEGQVFASVITDSANVYVGSADGYFYALDKTTGKQHWQQNMGGSKFSTASLHEQSVFVGSNKGKLFCLSTKSGAVNWEFSSRGEQAKDIWDYYLSQPSIYNNTIYWGSGDSCLYAIDALTGKKKWHFKSKGIIHANPLIAEGIVYISGFDGHLYALNAEDGTLIWKFKTLGAQYFPHGAIPKAPTLHNNILYLGSRDYNLYALNAQTGQCLWNYREPHGWIIASPLFYKDHLYFGLSDGHKMICMNAQSGIIKWECPINMRVFGEAIIHKGALVFGSHNGKLYALDPDNGELISEFNTKGNKANYHKIFDDKGEFLPGFNLYGADIEASEKKILEMGSILSTPHIDGGIIYFGSADGHIYATELKILKSTE